VVRIEDEAMVGAAEPAGIRSASTDIVVTIRPGASKKEMLAAHTNAQSRETDPFRVEAVFMVEVDVAAASFHP
jgi:hypothetical protein